MQNQDELNELISGWILEHSIPNVDMPNNERKTDYWEMLNGLVRNHPDKAWFVILSILNETQDEMIISNIAAGPLEKLIARHGDAIIDQIEAEARRNSRFLYALQGVWKNLSTDAVWQRVERVRNTP